jgi:CBS domain-containing protein/sporulation protein YlmC with PRC-barrel domain
MLYFAELAGKPVVSVDGARIGRLHDFYFLAADQPLITKLSVMGPTGRHYIPITSIKSINGTIILTTGYESVEPTEQELSIRKHLLDQQIIDIKGNKVVRVNDVVIQQKPYYVVAGVDVGPLGIARWLHLEQFVNKALSGFGKAYTSDFLGWDDIQPIELSRGKVMLKREETKLTRLAPEDLADHLERLSLKNLTKILELLPTEYEADVIQNLNVGRQRDLLRNIKPERAANILARIDPDEAADILLTLSERRRKLIIPFLPPEAKTPIDYLMSLSKTDIGELATNEFATCDPEETAGKVKSRLKGEANALSQLSYVYVINKKKELVGVYNLQELLEQENDTPIYKFMIPNVVIISLTTPKEIALKKMIKYKLYALPIISEKREVLGIVTIDDLLETMERRLI